MPWLRRRVHEELEEEEVWTEVVNKHQTEEGRMRKLHGNCFNRDCPFILNNFVVNFSPRLICHDSRTGGGGVGGDHNERKNCRLLYIHC